MDDVGALHVELAGKSAIILHDPVDRPRRKREMAMASPDGQQPEYPIHQKVAILHRMRQESSFDPCAANGPMHFLLQWRDDRLHRLHQATSSRPGMCPSWLAQMHFMDSEIRSNSRYAQFFYAENYPIAYRLFTQVYLGSAMGQLYN